MSRFIVGIDLGTTNCAVAYVDTEGSGEVTGFEIPQLIAPGEVAPRSTLASFMLLPTEHEVAPAAMALPWSESATFAVGEMARERGAELPQRLVSSAKSWLSNSAVDRMADILPWRGTEKDDDETSESVSPVDASARYLGHIRAAWDAAMGTPLADEQVFLTVPASFDAVARELTALAARDAGLANVTLLEEPQAAFYAWLAGRGDAWRTDLTAGDVILVCDIGGGTTDFSLIEATDDGSGNLSLERVAVGDHILLGGDNIDLALAYVLMQRLGDKAKELKSSQQRALVHACRRAKESLLGQDPPESVPVSILGRGSKLIGGTIRTEVKRSDLDTLLETGFFPEVEASARPKKRRAVGLKELGLPYADDPAVTRHLAEFLARHDRTPTAILWNGGVMKGARLKQRLAQIVGSWSSTPLRTLIGTDLDLAVAHGAAYYGLVRRGKGIRIRGGTARSYYIGVETAMPAIPGFDPPIKGLCVAPFGMEEGSKVDLPDEELGLVVGETAVFRFFASTSRNGDAPGALTETESDELVELAPVETTLNLADSGRTDGELVPVSLSAHVTEVGTLELWCVARDGKGRWKLEYSVRDTE